APAPATPPAPRPPAPGGMGGGFGGGFDGGADATPPRKRRTQHPADVERNKLRGEPLDKPITMSFASETPLDDVLKYIKESTKDVQGKSIPIYVDPIGL